MKVALCRLLNIYPGEGRNALIFGLLAFSWSLGINLGFKYSDALLLINVGAEALPTVYIISSCGMLLPAILLLHAINRVSSHKIFYSVVATVILFYSFVYLCMASGVDALWFWYMLKIVGFQLDALLITSYWTFIDRYHNMQNAKRMYVLFSLNVFLGQACTGFIMQLGLIPVKYIFLLVIAIMFFAASLIALIHRTIHFSHDPGVFEEEEEEGSSQPLPQTIRAIFASKFSLFVMLNNFVLFLMWVTAEYNYLSFFDRYFDSAGGSALDTAAKDAAITLFLGKILATVSVTNLVIGLFIYSRVARRFGVTTLLFLSPAVMLTAMGGWILHPVILFPILSYFVVEGFLEVIDDSNFNLLLNAIPKKLKYRTRILIESLLEPIAMCLSGLILLFPLVSPLHLCFLLSLMALASAFAIKKRYHAAVYKNLTESAIHFERAIKEWFTAEEIEENSEELLQIVAGDALLSDKSFAIDGILRMGNQSIINRLITILRGADGELKSRFIDQLIEQPNLIERAIAVELSRWLPEEKESEKKIRFLIGLFGLLHPENVYGDLISRDLFPRATAIVTLLASSQHLPSQVHRENRQLAEKALQELLDSSDESRLLMALFILGREPLPSHYKILLSYTTHPSLNICRKAMEMFSHLANKQCRPYAKKLINLLRSSQDSLFRKYCLLAIGKLEDPTLVRDIISSSLHFRPAEKRVVEAIIKKMGKSCIPTLLATTKESLLPDRCRALSGRILGHIALTHLQANLQEIVQMEIERAYFYYYYCHTVQKMESDIELSLLVEALKSSFHSVIEFIIQLLSAAGEVEDPDLIIRLFHSRNPRMRSQVIETLERTCEKKIFNRLRPLIENAPSSEVLRKYSAKKHPRLKLPELLEKLSLSSSPVDRLASITLMKELALSEWNAKLPPLLSSSEGIYRHFAKELMQS